MYKKRHLIITAVVTALIVFSGTTFLYSSVGAPIEADTLLRAKKIISSNYVDTLNSEQLTKLQDDAISAMVASLGDPYSRYLNTTGFESYQESNQEDYVGIGVSVNFDPKANTMTVMSPYDHSPAQVAGVLPGDIIQKVDGVTVTTDTYNDVITYIRSGGKEGDSITLHIKRGEKELDLTMQRSKVQIQTVSQKMFEDKIGYIRVAQFINSTEDDFKKAIAQLKDNEMKGLIIDLRNNPGGYAHTVLSMADMLLPKGTIAYLEDNKGKRQYFESDEKELGLPMVVLINGGTASASELLAGSLQAYDLATVVGEKSFGKAVGQTPYPLTGKTAIYLTNARYFTPKGECIDKIGIKPDVEVTMSDESKGKLTLLTLTEDNQLTKALEIMKQKLK